MSVNNRHRNSKRTKRAILLELEQAESIHGEGRDNDVLSPLPRDDFKLIAETYLFISPEQEEALVEHLAELNVHLSFAWLPSAMRPATVSRKIRFR